MKMKRREVTAHMFKHLDIYANEFLKHEDDEQEREQAANDFSKVSNAYNALLKNLSKKVQQQTFPTIIETYIEQREQDGWS